MSVPAPAQVHREGKHAAGITVSRGGQSGDAGEELVDREQKKYREERQRGDERNEARGMRWTRGIGRGR